MCAATSLHSPHRQGGRVGALTEGKDSKGLPQRAGPDLRKECLSRATERSASTMNVPAYKLLANLPTCNHCKALYITPTPYPGAKTLRFP